MINVIFTLNGFQTNIQATKEEKMKIICQKFASKLEIDINDINFIYGGEQINLELSFNEQANQIDKNKNEMNILVYERTQTIINEGKVYSKEIICPKCFENCKINIEDYKIKLFDCKNGHENNNILLSEFKNTQIIDESNINCDNCKNINKNKAYNKQFYKCLTCKLNLCPLCKSSHNNNHKIIEYNKKNFICESHNDFYISYCDECKLNLCMSCLAKHDKNHKLINFSNILPNEDELKEEMEKIRIKKDEFISNIKK